VVRVNSIKCRDDFGKFPPNTAAVVFMRYLSQRQAKDLSFNKFNRSCSSLFMFKLTFMEDKILLRSFISLNFQRLLVLVLQIQARSSQARNQAGRSVEFKRSFSEAVAGLE